MAAPHPNGDIAPAFARHRALEQIVRTPGRVPSPQPTNLGVPGTPQSGHSMHRVLSDKSSGYVAQVFKEKSDQMMAVMDEIGESGWIPDDFVEGETNWFYNKLGIDDMYFSTETVKKIRDNILSLYAAKLAAFARGGVFEVRLASEATDHAVYMDTSEPGVSVINGPRYEQKIDEKYIDGSTPSRSYRVESFRSMDTVPDTKGSFRCYFIYQCHFKNANPGPDETDINIVGEEQFLKKATQNTKDIYQEIMAHAVNRTGPVINMYEVAESREKRMVVAYRQGSAMGIFSALSDLYHYYGWTSSRKYVEQFSNGITIISLYLKPAKLPEAPKYPQLEDTIHQISKEISLLFCIPQTKLHAQFATGNLSLQESIYAHCVHIFIHQFLNRLGSEYASLVAALRYSGNANAELLQKIKKRLRSETFTSEYILEIINKYPDLVSALYLAFASKHYVRSNGEDEDRPTPSYQRISRRTLETDELSELIQKSAANQNDQMVMQYFLIFNESVLKTNFYIPTKVAISFRLRPTRDFLPQSDYPEELYGMFLVIGSEFRGFHLRFRDIARGGIRIVKSRNKEFHAINARTQFDENYNLANTQQMKNKDIPEGGAKGVILLDHNHQEKARVAFEKYIDSIMDLLLPLRSPGIKDPIVDLYNQQEILFMGPDENTADLVDWATEHAHARGAPWWKSFFTGKSPKLGGIPHDRYGMTTLSVREYVLGIYRKLDLNPGEIRKLQTGGPDGDLGSNEILLSNETYTAIVDGAGVLVDPQGLDRNELKRLAKNRQMISEYDISKLSSKGYRVLVGDMDITLPSNEKVNNGMIFRNTFHLRGGKLYDLFVPCGGRPESIDLSTTSKLIVKGKCTIPYIVEGANLFITQDAKLRLEEAGCVIYKDASANKGGVTSSSLEVLASLSFDDEGFRKNMCVGEDGTIPHFYEAYVKEVQETIQRNAQLEFDAIWREHEETGVPRSTLTDKLSVAITKLDEELQNFEELWESLPLRRAVFVEALPKTLQVKIGLDTILDRVPDNYLKAIFGSYLASRFVYEYGSTPSQFAFFDFMRKRMVLSRPAVTVNEREGVRSNFSDTESQATSNENDRAHSNFSDIESQATTLVN